MLRTEPVMSSIVTELLRIYGGGGGWPSGGSILTPQLSIAMMRASSSTIIALTERREAGSVVTKRSP
jgi:hypothetical protein